MKQTMTLESARYCAYLVNRAHRLIGGDLLSPSNWERYSDTLMEIFKITAPDELLPYAEEVVLGTLCQIDAAQRSYVAPLSHYSGLLVQRDIDNKRWLVKKAIYAYNPIHRMFSPIAARWVTLREAYELRWITKHSYRMLRQYLGTYAGRREGARSTSKTMQCTIEHMITYSGVSLLEFMN